MGKKNKFVAAIYRAMQEDESEKVTVLNDGDFEDFIRAHKFAVIDFWAEWCAPCLILSPVLDQLAEEIGDVGFGKLDTQNNQITAEKYGIMSLPTIMFFSEGKGVDQIIGVKSKSDLESWIKRLAK